MRIDDLLNNARSMNVSDVHITEGQPIAIRQFGHLKKYDYDIKPGEAEKLILSMCSPKLIESLQEGHDLDFAYQIDKKKRHRVNVYKHMTGLSAAIRIINDTIPTLETMNLPIALTNLADQPRGLILLTGPTGSGKSTSLAAMVDYITRKRAEHVLTIEDPIEYVFDQNNCVVHQRELGENVSSFATAIRSAMREDPDVILVGEMRDYETISAAITAAETGHLVMSTLHTTGASSTIDRIIDTCPPQIQSQMRNQLAMVLRGIVTQELLPLASNDGRVAATEILIGTDAVGNLIREDKCHQLSSIMQSSSNVGMHTLNGDLAKLYKQGKITREVALNASTDKADLEYYL